jgi:general secretion pathway protein L
MRFTHDPDVTTGSLGNASLSGASLSGPAGVWTLDGTGLIAADHDGPATVLVPSEAVRLLAVSLPITNRAKRLAALPFAVEDMIAEPIESVHLAIGAEIAPKHYLVGVVAHATMAEWVARTEEGGLEHAALVPDALALPTPGAGEWAVDLGATRCVVRRGDGTGFALAAPLLRTAWEAGGRPPMIAYGAPLPEDMGAGADRLEVEPLGRRLLSPALDLRQGAYARRRRSLPGFWKRAGQIAAVGIVAHAGIATADTFALQRIADRREAETRALVLEKAPGANLPADALAPAVVDLIPQGGPSGGSNPFLPAVTRVSAALATLSPTPGVRAMTLGADVVTIDLAPADPARIDAALRAAGVQATVSDTPAGPRISTAAR